MKDRLYGSVNKNVYIQYEWVSEPGACEKCQALDGTIYNSADEIPDKPHPNCKCRIDIKETEIEISDPIELYRQNIEERKEYELELAKLQGDAKSLGEEIDAYIEQIDEIKSEVEYYENSVDTNDLEPQENKK